jgi:transposase, IS30 family
MEGEIRVSHKHLTNSDRAKLAILLRTGRYTQKQIAALIGKSPSAICRELKRNKTQKGYNTRIASQKTRKRRHEANQAHRKLLPGSPLTKYVTGKIKLYWSPEQTSGRLRYEGAGLTVSYPTIYAYVKQHAELKQYLRHPSRYRRRYGTKKREKQRELAKKCWIDARPDTVNQRSRIGDWEGDTVLGDRAHKARLLTYVDRKSGKSMALKLSGGLGLAKQVADATGKIFVSKIPKKKRLTMTYDNGSEFNEHEVIERTARMNIYFAHPYHSWERGTNENTNGLYRQFFPKKTDLTNVSQKDIDRVTKLINNRPRKRHNYRTPNEVFKED